MTHLNSTSEGCLWKPQANGWLVIMPSAYAGSTFMIVGLQEHGISNAMFCGSLKECINRMNDLKCSEIVATVNFKA